MKYFAGIDIGGTFVKCGITDENGTLLAKKQIPTSPERHISLVARDIAGAIWDVASEAGVCRSDVAAVAAGMPGMLDMTNGLCIFAGNLGWKNVPVRQALSEALGIDSFILNDANAAALGEAICGAGKKYSDSILITLGTGVGGGIITNKKLFMGYKGAGGEIGHMVINTDGQRCTCGRNGCFEAYASATALIRQAKHRLLLDSDKRSILWELCDGNTDGIDGALITKAVAMEDKLAVSVWERYTDYIAEGTANLVNIIRPEVVIYGGGVSKAGRLLLDFVLPRLEGRIFGGTSYAGLDVAIAKLGNDAGIAGAAIYARDSITN